MFLLKTEYIVIVIEIIKFLFDYVMYDYVLHLCFSFELYLQILLSLYLRNTKAAVRGRSSN